MKNSWQVHLALCTVALIYAANYSIAKDVMPRYAGPYGLIVLRVLTAALVFGVLARFTGNQRIEGRADNIRSVLCGITGIGLNQLLFFGGLNLTTPINASLTQTVSPIVVLLASAVLLGERVTRKRVAGILIAGIGAALLISGRGSGDAPLPPTATLGNVLVLLNAVSFGIYLVLVTPLMRKYHPLTVLARIFLVGAVIVLPFGWEQVQRIDYTHLPAGVWAGVLYVVIPLTIFTYLLNNWALKYAAPALLGVYIYLQPVLAVIIAVALGKDTFTGGRALQAALIFAGVWLVSQKPKGEPTAAVPLEPVQD